MSNRIELAIVARFTPRPFARDRIAPADAFRKKVGPEFLSNTPEAKDRGSLLATNLADREPGLCRELFTLARDEARGPFPDFLLGLAAETRDAPGCSAVCARD